MRKSEENSLQASKWWHECIPFSLLLNVDMMWVAAWVTALTLSCWWTVTWKRKPKNSFLFCVICPNNRNQTRIVVWHRKLRGYVHKVGVQTLGIPSCYDQSPDQKKLRGGRVYSSSEFHRGYSPAERTKQQGPEAAVHIISVVRKVYINKDGAGLHNLTKCSTPSDSSSPARCHLLKVHQLSETVPPAGSLRLNNMIWWGKFYNPTLPPWACIVVYINCLNSKSVVY